MKLIKFLELNINRTQYFVSFADMFLHFGSTNCVQISQPPNVNNNRNIWFRSSSVGGSHYSEHCYFECHYSKCCYFEYRDLLNVALSEALTQTWYSILGFHGNILCVAKVCTISEN